MNNQVEVQVEVSKVRMTLFQSANRTSTVL